MSEFNEHVWRRKKAIISQVKSIAYNGDLRTGAEEIRRLREEFKRAGRAGTDTEGVDQDEVLGSEFNQAEDAFYERRRQANEQAIAYRRNLIHEVGKLSYTSDAERVREELKRLRTLWNEAPWVPKRDNDQLWNEFKKQIDYIQSQLNSQYRDNLQERISKAKEARSNYQSQLYEVKIDWQYSQRPEPSSNSSKYWEIMEKRRERERRHQEKVERLESKIRDIDASIERLESKLARL